jgi:hypothetical protein
MFGVLTWPLLYIADYQSGSHQSAKLAALYTRLVIPIAVYNEADLLPMDERRGRAVARRNPKTADNSLKNRAPAVV